jgi:superfamily II DNA helicase RecQ
VQQQKMRKYAEGKTVVYCSSVGKLAEALDCDGYYHDAAEKDEKFRAFVTGQKKVIVAMSVLGMGERDKSVKKGKSGAISVIHRRRRR